MDKRRDSIEWFGDRRNEKSSGLCDTDELSQDGKTRQSKRRLKRDMEESSRDAKSVCISKLTLWCLGLVRKVKEVM